MKDVVRWLLVLPGGIAAGLLATFPLHWALVSGFGASASEDKFITLNHSGLAQLELGLTPLVMALTYVVVGTAIAPKWKFKTSLVLGALYVAGMLFIFSAAGPYAAFGWKAIGALLGVSIGIFWASKAKPVHTSH